MIPARHHLRACARTCRSGAGRLFASAPPTSGFVCDFAIEAARQCGPLKRVCIKPPVTAAKNRAVPRALGSARWPASLLRVCVYRPFPNQDAQADRTLCKPSGLELRLSLCRCSSFRLLARPAVRPTPTFGYGAVSRRCSKWRHRR
jgi:hypothetical protein